MSDTHLISLNNPSFSGRLRQFNRGQPVGRNLPPRPSHRYVNGMVTNLQPRPKPVVEKPVPVAPVQFNDMVTNLQPRPKPIVKKPLPFAPIHPAKTLDMPRKAEPELLKAKNKQLIVKKAELLARHQIQVAHIKAKRRHLGYLALKSKSKKRFRFNFGRLTSLSKLQYGIVGMALFIFAFGLVITIQTLVTNHNASAQVQALSRSVGGASGGAVDSSSSSSSPPPSTVKPSAAAVASYVVAPNLPKYINIPKLGVHARVLQVGVLASGALGTPDNVYDAAWYTGSAEPGQPGATLIDGHVSSWTTRGVFYGIHTLVAGDKIQIVTGANLTVNYTVVKTVVYPSGNVNMDAAITPVTQGVSGLNLITCTGEVIKGTSQFNQRVIVFAKQD